MCGFFSEILMILWNLIPLQSEWADQVTIQQATKASLLNLHPEKLH